jgi:hypothetical protein
MIVRNRRTAAGALTAAVVGALLSWSLATASAGPPPPDDVDFSTLNARPPVAGRVFEGLTIINRTGLNNAPEKPSAVRCDAEVGGRRLRARKLVYGEPRLGYMQVIVCGWLIPADAAGKTLRFWKNRDPGCIGCGRRAVAVFENSGSTGSPEYTWRIRKP